MRSGIFNRRGVIDQPNQSRTAAFPTEAWTTFTEVDGSFRWTAGQEQAGLDHTIATKRGTFYMRHIDGVNEKMRFRLTDEDPARYFQIISVIDPGERRRFLELHLVEVPKEAFAR